jgi:hypothetical protein
MLQLPQDLISEANPHRQIQIEHCTILESCMYQEEMRDSAIISQHELIYILQGSLHLQVGSSEVLIQENEALLLKKGSYFDFLKRADRQQYKSILFLVVYNK